jgi:hypothetical protein
MLSFEQFLNDAARLPRPRVHRRLTPLLTVLLTAALLHAAPNQAPGTGQDTVTIVVVDPLGNPLPGASIDVREGRNTNEVEDGRERQGRVPCCRRGTFRAASPPLASGAAPFGSIRYWSTTLVISLEIGGLPDPQPQSNFRGSSVVQNSPGRTQFGDAQGPLHGSRSTKSAYPPPGPEESPLVTPERWSPSSSSMVKSASPGPSISSTAWAASNSPPKASPPCPALSRTSPLLSAYTGPSRPFSMFHL